MNPQKLKAILLSLLIGAVMIAVPAYGTDGTEVRSSINLSDIHGHWAEDAIRQAVNEGWVNGYPDGTFRPDGSITRAEYTKMLLAAVRLTPRSDAVSWMQRNALFYSPGKDFPSREPTAMFTDMDLNWLTKQGWTETAVFSGILIPDDYFDHRFQPEKEITRGEIAVLTDRSLGLVYPATQDLETQSSFTEGGSN